MKLIGPEAGRVVFLFASEELRSNAGIIGSEFIRAVKDRYQFGYVPDLIEAKGDMSMLTFRTGKLEAPTGPRAISEFTILTGGVIVDAQTTDDGELFLQDLLDWGMATFGWNEPKTHRERFFSSIVVELESELEPLLAKLDEVCEIFSDALREQYFLQQPYKLKSLTLACDPMDLPASAVQTDIVIQRRVEVPFQANRFHCTGPFRTYKLAELIQRTEAALLPSGGR